MIIPRGHLHERRWQHLAALIRLRALRLVCRIRIRGFIRRG